MKDFTFNDDYVRLLKAGDVDVERHFISYFTVLLRVKLRSKLRSPQLIEDVRQETFLRVLVSLRKENGVHTPERLGAFVNAVCNNVMLEAFRGGSRERQMSPDTPERIDEGADPTRELVDGERKRIIGKILSEMPAKDRELIRRVFLDETDKDFIAKDLGVNPEYLRVLIHRAKGRFRELYKKMDGK